MCNYFCFINPNVFCLSIFFLCLYIFWGFASSFFLISIFPFCELVLEGSFFSFFFYFDPTFLISGLVLLFSLVLRGLEQTGINSIDPTSAINQRFLFTLIYVVLFYLFLQSYLSSLVCYFFLEKKLFQKDIIKSFFKDFWA